MKKLPIEADLERARRAIRAQTKPVVVSHALLVQLMTTKSRVLPAPTEPVKSA